MPDARTTPVRSLLDTAVLTLAVSCGGEGAPPSADAAAMPADRIAALRAEVRDRPDDAGLRLRLGRAYLEPGDGAAAESQLARAQKLGADDARLTGDIARSLLMQDRHLAAFDMLEPLTTGDPADARLLMLLGEAQLGLANYDRATIRDTFIEAHTAAADAATAARLATLATMHPMVASAAAHVACRSVQPRPIDPPPADTPAGRVLEVGPGRELAAPSEAAALARDGDTIEIDAGLYEGDVAIWTQNDLVLRGVGGRAHLAAAGRAADGKGIWVFEGDNITAENIEFSGAKVPNRNGAGIRLAGNGATIRNCHFHDNENGILGAKGSNRPIVVEFSIFERNGYGDGLSHNIYVHSAVSFTLRHSYSHGARIGHLVKSRAHHNAILYNRLMDHEDGTASYVINLPNGGRAYIIGNELQQGPAADNPIMISYGEEEAVREDMALYVVNNTFYNHVLDATYVRNATTAGAVIANNLFAGAPALLLDGPGTAMTNERRPGPWLVDAHGPDYRLTPEAPVIDAGTPTDEIAGFDQAVDAVYRHPARGRSREPVWRIDVGAHEFCGF